MASDTDDPVALFAPSRRTATTSPSLRYMSEVPATPEPKDASSGRDASVERVLSYVSPPHLSSQERNSYRTVDISDSEPDPEEEQIVEFVGEYRLGTDLFLYARYQDGICRRKFDREFKISQPKLYAEYQQKKEEGVLEPFDPSASYVHYKDRVRMVININRRRATTGAAKASGAAKTSKTSIYKRKAYISDNTDSESSEDFIDHSDDGPPVKHQRGSTKIAHAKKGIRPRNLPFSPQKTRSMTGARASRVAYDVDEDSEEEAHVSVRVTRSKTGTKKQKLAHSEYEGSGNDTEESEKPRPRKLKKKTIRGKTSRPAYGQIRVVADLYDSEPETATLRAHRDVCEKCHKEPAHILLEKFRKKKGHVKKRKKKDEDESSDDEEQSFEKLGGWVRCLKCCVAAHWHCLASTQRDEILRAARGKDVAQNLSDELPRKRITLDIYQTTEFICGSCSKGGICLVCREVAVQPDNIAQPKAKDTTASGDMLNRPESNDKENPDVVDALDHPKLTCSPTNLQTDQALDLPSNELLFRCFTCKRLAHYAHLPVDLEGEHSPVATAAFYQDEQDWLCSDCASYTYPLDKIIAWRPYPPNSVEQQRNPTEPPNYKANLPREYLVKWTDRSYRRTQWVPHMWLLSTNPSKLKNFVAFGSKVDILNSGTAEDIASSAGEKGDTFGELFPNDSETTRDPSVIPETQHQVADNSKAAIDAESRIPPAWKTVDRVLDILFWHPRKRALIKTSKKSSRQKGKGRVSQYEDSDGNNESDVQSEYLAAFDEGEQPSEDLTATVEEWEEAKRNPISLEDIDKVIWAFIKWNDLGYEEATWDSPPQPGAPGYGAFEVAFKRFIKSRDVRVAKMSKKVAEDFKARGGRKHWASTVVGIPENGSYDIGQARQLNLMDFQVYGVNWLCRNWFHHQQSILADEMGLGKTVQIVTFLGLLAQKSNAFPALVIVPNSTITNWVREFTRWAPKLRVVPFFGESKAREMIKQYELYHTHTPQGCTSAKYHVLITTYEAAINQKDFGTVFKATPRWEVLVVDEGQRLKNDSSLLFKRLNELNSFHRVIMTGTPLNNNVRELFNLMNFLDPDAWNNLDALEKEHEVLTEELVKELHEKLRPYFLRRVKADVLKLPPKNEVIVPVSMAPLQKEVYKSILSQNLNLLNSLTQQASTSGVNSSVVKKSNLNNMLMQLRKCLQHPYLIADDIEPKGLSNADAHAKLIDGSGKLRLLKILLPKLRARRHRVLLFSQFVIALNVIEDFLIGEGFKYLRLDGNTKQADRQVGMDEFNKEGSDIFIYILSTRAGGVGINLWSADTVIIFDPDFNPHQDLQAIARSHRYGQTKTCLVFKLMVKDSAEERIMQAGKKKLVLDHLIVQKMDDDESSSKDVQSILMFGAKALFEDSADHTSHDMTYSENDVENLIERTEKEGDQEGKAEDAEASFAFAKVWSAHKDSLEELSEGADVFDEQTDSWAQTLAKIASQRAPTQAEEASGRGVRRKAAITKALYYDGSPEKPKGKGKGKGKKKHQSQNSDASDMDYAISRTGSVIDTEGESESMPQELKADMTSINVPTSHGAPVRLSDPNLTHSVTSRRKPAGDPRDPSFQTRALSPIHNRSQRSPEFKDGDKMPCGLCGTLHSNRGCHMTQSSVNLAEYRKMLMYHGDDEPWDDRWTAIRSIDETLYKRGDIYLIQGQPLNYLDPHNKQAGPSQSKAARHSGGHSNNRQPTISNLPKPEKKSKKESDNTRASAKCQPQSVVYPIFQKRMISGEDSTGLKRAASPSHVTDLPKKKRTKSVGHCSICNKSPHHLAVDCSVVAQGPKKVLQAIERLNQEGGHAETISILRSIFRKQKRRESAGLPISTPSNS